MLTWSPLGPPNGRSSAKTGAAAANTASAATDDNKTFFIVLSPFFILKIFRYFVTSLSILLYHISVNKFFS